jgi:hypothetical protein
MKFILFIALGMKNPLGFYARGIFAFTSLLFLLGYRDTREL